MNRNRRDLSGQGLVEYVLIIALIVVVCIVGLRVFGSRLNERTTSIAESVPESTE